MKAMAFSLNVQRGTNLSNLARVSKFVDSLVFMEPQFSRYYKKRYRFYLIMLLLFVASLTTLMYRFLPYPWNIYSLGRGILLGFAILGMITRCILPDDSN
jgi:hypothetical protein